MGHLYAEMVSMGLAVVSSPEILLAGLWAASVKEQGKRKVWLFFFGSEVGLLIFLLLGFCISSAAPSGPSWIRFYLRLFLGVLLIVIGFYALLKKGMKLKRSGDNEGKMSFRASVILGLIITGLNIKVATISLSAGHAVAEASLKVTGALPLVAVYLGLASVPALIPTALETLMPGSAAIVMTPFERFLDRYGKWVAAAVCVIMGGIFLKGAMEVMP